jgi:hypothetical protein
LQKLLDIALDVAIITVIVASFLWGAYAVKTRSAVVTDYSTPFAADAHFALGEQ